MLKCDGEKSVLLMCREKAFYSDKEREAACTILRAVDGMRLDFAEDLLRSLANELHFFSRTTTTQISELLSNVQPQGEQQSSPIQQEN